MTDKTQAVITITETDERVDINVLFEPTLQDDSYSHYLASRMLRLGSQIINGEDENGQR